MLGVAVWVLKSSYKTGILPPFFCLGKVCRKLIILRMTLINWVSIAEASTQSSFSYPHISYLVRHAKINGRKSGNIWLVDLESLKEYERGMQELGSKKHSPKPISQSA